MQALRREFCSPRRSAGVAAVEFVIAVPILIFVLLAIAELGRAFVQYDTLSYSIRNSARYVSENAIVGTTGVVDVSGAVAAAQNLAVYGTPGGGGTPVLPGFATGHVSVSNAGGGNIEVIASYPYQPLIGSALPMFRGGAEPTTFNMRISVIMRAIS
jgi:Flp pilus assembly protein TadG